MPSRSCLIITTLLIMLGYTAPACSIAIIITVYNTCDVNTIPTYIKNMFHELSRVCKDWRHPSARCEASTVCGGVARFLLSYTT